MIEFQRLLMGDRVRNDAFAKALKKSIVPGKTTIADVGSGTGFLSFVAERHGAKECFLYELSDLLDVSKTIAKENGMRHCKFFQTHSTAVKNPPRVDVVVSEVLGNFALEENIIETLNDAKRFLKPGGVMIPANVRQFVAPVTSSRLFDELNVWDDIGHDLRFHAAKEICMNNMYVKDIVPKDLASAKGPWSGLEWDAVDFYEKNSSIREGSSEWKTERAVTVYGLAVWWESLLVPGVTVSTSPFAKPTHWKQIYLPLTDPAHVPAGGVLEATIRSDSRYEVKINVSWETVVRDAAGKKIKTYSQDMQKGYIG